MAHQPHYNKELDVRPLTGTDLPQARQVGGRAFNQHCEEWYGAQSGLGGFDRDGKLVCALAYQPESLWWGPAQIPAAAIGGVATDPDHQGQGHAGGLMVGAVHHLREQGYYICPLWPFSYRWYGKFGWACPGPVIELKVWPQLLRQTTALPGPLRQATEADAAAVHRLYTDGARLRNGQSVRSEEFWCRETVLPHLWVLEGENGELDCSALVKVEDIRRGQGRQLTLRELHGAVFAPQMQLVRSLAELDEITTLNLTLPDGSLFLHAFPERFDITVKHTMDLRILDLKQALAQLKPPKSLRATISFEVCDWVVDAVKPLTVTAQAEGGEIAVQNGTKKDALRCDINTFTQLFSGGLSAVQAREMGHLAGGDSADDTTCDALFGRRVPYRSSVEAG
jgi:predicted acetyltransferase